MGDFDIERAARDITIAVSELPDRNSPEDWPEAMLVTVSELHEIATGIMRRELTGKPTYTFMGQAESIVNSKSVISIYAACEWDELSEDGKVWIAGIVRETLVRASASIAAIEPDEEAAGCPATWGDFVQIAQAAIMPEVHCG